MGSEMQILRGMGVSGGIAIGKAVCIETRGPDVFRIPLALDQVEEEVSRLYEGARHARHELPGKLPVDVGLADHRQHALVHEPADAVADGALLLGERLVDLAPAPLNLPLLPPDHAAPLVGQARRPA
mgnify:CR=1 FL=1